MYRKSKLSNNAHRRVQNDSKLKKSVDANKIVDGEISVQNAVKTYDNTKDCKFKISSIF